MPALLAIDPGNSTGIAFFRADGSHAFRTWKLACVDGGRLVELDRLLDGQVLLGKGVSGTLSEGCECPTM